MLHYFLHVSLTLVKAVEVLTSVCAHLSRTGFCCQIPYLKFLSWLLTTCQFQNHPFLSFLWKLPFNKTFVHLKLCDFLYLVSLTVSLFLTLLTYTSPQSQEHHFSSNGLSPTYLTSLSPSVSGIILWYTTFCHLVLIYLWHLMLPSHWEYQNIFPQVFIPH